MDRKELFSKVKRKAHIYEIPIDDGRLDYLASLFTGGLHDAYYMGRLGDPARGEVSDYVLLLWKEESGERAAICIKGENLINDPETIREPDYTFLVFHINDGSPKLKAIHSTEKPTKRKELSGEMGSVTAFDTGGYDYTIFGSMNNALNARIREEKGS